MKLRKHRRIHPLKDNLIQDPFSTHIFGICTQKLKFFIFLYIKLYLLPDCSDDVTQFGSHSELFMTEGESTFFLRKRGTLRVGDLCKKSSLSTCFPYPFSNDISEESAIKLVNLFSVNKERTEHILNLMTSTHKDPSKKK